MELHPYTARLHQRWRLLVILPVFVLLISGVAAALEPANYGTEMRLLVTRDAQAGGQAGLSDRGEDTTAQDLPAILQSSAFRADLAADLARRGFSLGDAALAASFSEHIVTVAARANDSAAASVIAEAVIALLRANGLRYWGEQNAATQPGLTIGVLDPPAPPTRTNGPRALAMQLALRALLGLGAAVGLVLLPAAARAR